LFCELEKKLNKTISLEEKILKFASKKSNKFNNNYKYNGDALHKDPDQMTYEELLELEERIGNVNIGFSEKEIESIESFSFNDKQNIKNLKCMVCILDFENKETLLRLSCKHEFHKNCIKNWLSKGKSCPICKSRVEIYA